ncbi:phytase [Wenxinia marina]|uniref:phytase n=1 Tax=Wenxinia marina TaxID=390641 RepID=UPI000B1B1295|nr:phytase [Wenxinia marina]
MDGGRGDGHAPDPLADRRRGLDADAYDPAIWVSPDDPAQSLVVTAVKNGGIRVYGRDGSLIQTIPPIEDSWINNIDVVYDVPMADGTTADLAIGADRGRDYVRAYRIDPPSSQGGAHGEAPTYDDAPYDDNFVVFSVDEGIEPLGAFRIVGTDEIDGVQESDGDGVISVALPGFPNGVFITQDGYAGDLNDLDGETAATNFKFVNWAAIAESFDPPLMVTPASWDPLAEHGRPSG